MLLSACDPCADLVCLPPDCPLPDGPPTVHGQVTVALGALRRAANEHLLRDGQPARRRFQPVEGVGTVGILAPPTPISLVPVDGHPDRLRFVGTVPLMLSRGPERPAQHQFEPVGRVVAKYDLQARIEVVRDGPGWAIGARLLDDTPPSIELGTLPDALPANLAEAGRGLAEGMALQEATMATQGLVLGRVTPWPGLAGPAQLDAVTAVMDGAFLRVGLTPRGALGEGLPLGERALDPGAGQDLTVALSSAWISALANATGDREERIVRSDGVDYRLGTTLSGTPPMATIQARRQDTCGWADVEQPVKVGRTGARWGIAPKGNAAAISGGADDELSTAAARGIAEHGTRLLNDRFLHPVFTAADRRPLEARIIRYEGGVLLFDGAIPAAPTALKVPRKRRAPKQVPPPGLPTGLPPGP